MLQICSHWLNVGAVAGMLYLMMELSKTIPEISDLLVEFASRPDDTEESSEKDTEEVDKTKDENKDIEYDPRKRDPKFANANRSSLWEIHQFLNHYHPTIAIYASSFLDGTEQVKPDLGLYTLSHFWIVLFIKMLNKTTNKRFIYYAAFGWCSYRIFCWSDLLILSIPQFPRILKTGLVRRLKISNQMKNFSINTSVLKLTN